MVILNKADLVDPKISMVREKKKIAEEGTEIERMQKVFYLSYRVVIKCATVGVCNGCCLYVRYT